MADHYADRDDDWDEITQQEAWLATAESEPFSDDLDLGDYFDMAVEAPEQVMRRRDRCSAPMWPRWD